MALHIDGPQSGDLSAAIERAIPTFMELQQVLNHKLNDSIFNYAGFGAQFPEMRYSLIQEYNSRYHIDKLVLALLEYKPTNEDLLRFAWRHRIIGRAPQAGGAPYPRDDSLERMLDPARGFRDPMAVAARILSGTLAGLSTWDRRTLTIGVSNRSIDLNELCVC